VTTPNAQDLQKTRGRSSLATERAHSISTGRRRSSAGLIDARLQVVPLLVHPRARGVPRRRRRHLERACSRPNGWLFEIYDGGWLAEQTARPGVLLAMNPGVREFLVTGDDDCVSVLALSPYGFRCGGLRLAIPTHTGSRSLAPQPC